MKLFKFTFASISALIVAFSANADSITVVSWGGAYTKSQVEAYHKPWSHKRLGTRLYQKIIAVV